MDVYFVFLVNYHWLLSAESNLSLIVVILLLGNQLRLNDPCKCKHRYQKLDSFYYIDVSQKSKNIFLFNIVEYIYFLCSSAIEMSLGNRLY